MGLWAWWQQKKARRFLDREARKNFAFRWSQYADIDCPERDALMNYLTARRRRVELSKLLSEQGYRHGDHVLVFYYDGSFREEVVTKFYDEPSLMSPDMVTQYEETQGTRVKPKDRSQRKSQPDFTSHEHDPLFVSLKGEIVEGLSDTFPTALEGYPREVVQYSYLFAHYYVLFCTDPEQYKKEMTELARKKPKMAEDFKHSFQKILQDYKNKMEKEIEETEKETARILQGVEEKLEELERRKFGQEPKRDCVGEEDEDSK